MQNKKILLCITERNNQILGLQTTLEAQGYDVILISADTYENRCSYWEKKLYKLGRKSGEQKYLQKWRQDVFSLLESGQVDIFFTLNLPDEFLTLDDMHRLQEIALQKKIRTITWIVDPLLNNKFCMQYCTFFDAVYTYEKNDEIWLQNQGVNAAYCPVGYRDEYEHVGPQRHDIDVFFIGTPYKDRLALLNVLAIKGKEKDWKLLFAGPFYKNPIKKLIFRLRYPAIYPYVVNKTMDAAEIADYYGRAKICLNIHTSGAEGLNPRAFDILAAGAFQLVDERQYYDQCEVGRDIVSYQDEASLIEKVSYYLENDEVRDNIAVAGRDAVVPTRSFASSVAYMMQGNKL
ncbi:glycosyltransferase family protein [Selenomonas ruminantium]|uniref:Spore maturation protein CgeB n=1 Tax=Selenomonas ruminantium TaxID=971 RepID=A0A1H0PKP1_SELRU|nr:glycosyltransferase [Selenomonas ruminantium]SDP05166.1 Spore maturation protein CgeB [Selenomonas ruminantium]